MKRWEFRIVVEVGDEYTPATVTELVKSVLGPWCVEIGRLPTMPIYQYDPASGFRKELP